MATCKKGKKLNSTQWALLLLLVLYWFVFFPIIWFAVKPPAFVASKSSVCLYAVLLFGIYVALHCILYCCLKSREKKPSETVLRKYQPPEEITPKDVKAMNEAMGTARFSRKERPTSKRVPTPRIPPPSYANTAVDAESNEYPYGGYERTYSDSQSTVTIPLHVKNDEKVRFVSKQELYFDGSSFLNQV